jgi:hypothetical protein
MLDRNKNYAILQITQPSNVASFLFLSCLGVVSKRFPETSYHSYNITLRHNPKELQHQFYLGESFRSHIKSKAVPLQAWSGPEGSKKLRFSDFMKTAQDGGTVVSLTHRPPLPPGNTPGTNFC